jgi:hypothetical protein
MLAKGGLVKEHTRNISGTFVQINRNDGDSSGSAPLAFIGAAADHRPWTS